MSEVSGLADLREEGEPALPTPPGQEESNPHLSEVGLMSSEAEDWLGMCCRHSVLLADALELR